MRLQGSARRVILDQKGKLLTGREVTDWSDATFPEVLGKILSTGGDGEKGERIPSPQVTHLFHFLLR